MSRPRNPLPNAAASTTAPSALGRMPDDQPGAVPQLEPSIGPLRFTDSLCALAIESWSGSFPPPELPGLNGRTTLSDSRPIHRQKRC